MLMLASCADAERQTDQPGVARVVSADPPGAGSEASGCSVEGAADSIQARRAGEACAAARGRFMQLIESPAPHLSISFDDVPKGDYSASDSSASLEFPRSILSQPEASGVSAPATQRLFLVQHEACHAMLLAEALRRSGSGMHAGTYGTPLPDWFDEGVAISCEPQVDRSARLARAKAQPDTRFDLARLWSMPHPATKRSSAIVETQTRIIGWCRGECPGPPTGTMIRTTTFVDGTSVADTIAPPADGSPIVLPETWYYPLSYSLLAYIRTIGGSAAVNALFDRLDGGWPGVHVLESLPGLPPDTASLRRAWLRWVRRVPDDAID
jgi:hypothetical protein